MVTLVGARAVRARPGAVPVAWKSPYGCPMRTPPQPLPWWSSAWRYVAAILLGFILLAMVVDALPPSAEAEAGWDVLIGLGALVALLPHRRRAPLATATALAAVSALSAFSLGALAVAVVSLATRQRWRELAWVGALSLGARYVHQVVIWRAESLGWWTTVLTFAGYAVCAMVGLYVGSRRDLQSSLLERAETAEREQIARLDQARSAERARIAREMHDVLAHRISLVAMHAGGLVFRTDLSREETAATAAIIRDNSHQALAELREVLGVLRDDDPTRDPDRPQPTLAALPVLLDEARAAGSDVTCEVAPSVAEDLGALPATTGRHAYRILQEALTNARKHAPGAPVRLRVEGAAGDRVTLTAQNPVPVRAVTGLPGAGVGLAGLVERARLAGGELTHEVDHAGDFIVRAWLPWPT